MIDYYADQVSLSHFTTALSAAALPEPAVASARDQALAAVDAEPGAALLGAFHHHLLQHAASDGAELDLLSRAADLWGRGTGLCSRPGDIRAGLEAALGSPGDPGAADRFNAASTDSLEFGKAALLLRDDIDTLRADVLRFPHLPPHPRQRDRPTTEWDWGNLTTARRTAALTKEFSNAAVDQATTAFAVGATASYGANAVVSAYLGQTVGGPRRSHRYRDRLARNAVGSWLAANDPTAVDLTDMAATITFGPPGQPTLPAPLETAIRAAVSRTFDLGQTIPLPDIQQGYRRLIAHLTLLAGFRMPAVPALPAQEWLAIIYSDPGNPPQPLVEADLDLGAGDGGGMGVTYGPAAPGPPTPGGTDSGTQSGGCGIGFILAVIVLIVVDLLQAFVQCVGQWSQHHPCTFWDNMILKALWKKDSPDPRDPTGPTGSVTAQQLTVLAQSPQAATLIGKLHDVHQQAWEALDKARVFFATTGLIYPREMVSSPLFAQFITQPAVRPWPHREDADPAASYHLYPTSPLENPLAQPAPIGVGATPADCFEPDGDASAVAQSLALWRQVARQEPDRENLDLDADRGYSAPCWAAASSVLDDPIGVVVLAYNAQ